MKPSISLTTPTGTIVDHVLAIRFEELPDNAMTVALHAVRDWLAVGIAGAIEPVSELVKQEVVDNGSTPQASVFGLKKQVSAHDAALCNGTAAHALDFDDVLESMLGHPTAPIMSAVFAVGERLKATGAQVLTAYIAGVEAASLLGRMIEPGHHELGWHTTGTIGTFGATAATAHLMGLTPNQTEQAFGLAGAQAAGLKVNFGTMAKPFHAGRAAANGVLAASLASRGVTATRDIIASHQGFADLTTNTANFSLQKTPHRSDSLEVEDLLFKRHASCYLTHSLIEGLTEVRERLHQETGRISRIAVRVPPVHMTTCGLETFDSDLEGKFSMRYLAALALVAGAANEEHFSAAWRADPEVVRLAELVDIIVVDSVPQMANPVEVHTTDREMYRACVDVGQPARTAGELETQGRRLIAKYHSLVNPILGLELSAMVSAHIQNIPYMDEVGSFMRYASHGAQ